MTSKSNQWQKRRKPMNEEQQQPTSQKLPGGSPKQVPSLGVFKITKLENYSLKKLLILPSDVVCHMVPYSFSSMV